jgi:guanylate kinase
MKKGLLILFSGPSGVGKGSIRREIVSRNVVDFAYSVSMTTRIPRDKEVDGVDYFFVSKEEFLKNIENNNFLEYTEFVGNFYGTPKDKVEALRNEGKNVFLEIEINGAKQVMENVKDEGVISFFLVPPSLKDLEDRIRKRKSETEDIIQQRLAKGAKEMTMTENYDHIILNDTVQRAASEVIKHIINKQNSLK